MDTTNVNVDNDTNGNDRQKEESSNGTNTTGSTSLVAEALAAAAAKNGDGAAAAAADPFLLAKPADPNFIYPVSVFPPMSVFDISMEYPALVVPARRIGELRQQLKSVLLSRPKLKVVHNLCPEDVIPSKATEPRDKFRKMILANEDDKNNNGMVQELVSSGECALSQHTVTVSYADWTVEEVLRRILPVEEVPSAFEIIGHIAHVNLRDDVLPFKYIVGKVIWDKNSPRIQTVVNKIGTIETEFRTFGMEIIAGNVENNPNWSLVTVKEEGCQYTLDFQKVYWNSRLGGEHRRLVDLIGKDATQNPTKAIVVADLMAGIGPFAVPLTCKGFGNVDVHANDLNPHSYEYLLLNSKNNKCQHLKCYNMDARAFCHQLQDHGIEFQHVLMNLPKTALEFLDAFRGFIGQCLPRIHVHCFASKDPQQAEKESLARCEKALGCPLDMGHHHVDIHTVRNIAPNKNMYCISFDCPEAVRGLPRIELGQQRERQKDQRDPKRTKLN